MTETEVKYGPTPVDGLAEQMVFASLVCASKPIEERRTYLEKIRAALDTKYGCFQNEVNRTIPALEALLGLRPQQ